MLVKWKTVPIQVSLNVSQISFGSTKAFNHEVDFLTEPDVDYEASLIAFINQ